MDELSAEEQALFDKLIELGVLTPEDEGYRIDRARAELYAPGLWEMHMLEVKQTLEQLWAEDYLEPAGIDQNGDMTYIVKG